MIKLTAKTSQLFTSSPPHREAWACFSPTSAEGRRLPSGGNGRLWIRTRGHGWDFLAQHLSVCREHVLGGAHEGPGCNPPPLSTAEKASKNQVACYEGKSAKLSSEFFTSAFHARRQWSNTKGEAEEKRGLGRFSREGHKQFQTAANTFDFYLC